MRKEWLTAISIVLFVFFLALVIVRGSTRTDVSKAPMPSAPGVVDEPILDPPTLTPARVEVEPRAPAAEATSRVAHSLHGMTLDSAGLSIPGARVALVDEEGMGRACTVSDDRGRFAITRSWAEGWALTAEKEGYATARERALPPPELDHPVVLTLTEGATISGWIRLASGEPVANVRALAWRVGEVDPAGIDSAIEDYPLLRSATSDERGWFEIRGLRRDQRYQVVAGGRGFAQVPAGRKLPLVEEAGVESVEIVLAPVYVLDVRIEDAAGGALASSPLLFPYPSISCSPGPDLESLWIGSPVASLAVSWERWRGDPESSHRFFQVFTSDVELPRVGPLHLDVAAPGYERTAIDVWALRAVSEVPMQTIALNRSRGAFGSVRISFSPTTVGPLAERPVREAGALTPFARIRFYPQVQEDMGSSYLESALWAPSHDGLLLEGVPSGFYKVNVVTPFLPPITILPGEVIHVADGGMTEVLLDSGAWGSVSATLLLPGEGEAPWVGQSILEVKGPLPARTSGMYAFRHPPYLVRGLRPGEYQVTASTRMGGSDRAHATVIGGSECDVTLRMKEGPF